MPTDPRVEALRLAEFGIPERFRTVTLDYLGWLPEESDLVENLVERLVTKHRTADDYPDDWTRVGRGIAYVGAPGRGKTTHAIATLLEVYHRYGLPVLFLPFAEYVTQLKDGWRPSGLEQTIDLQTLNNRLRTYPLVVLDDIGKEDSRGGLKERFGADILDQVLRHRHASGRPTIITTNIARSDWAEKYGEYTASFVHEAFDWVPMTGKDYRAQG